MSAIPPESRASYRHFLSITTRWMDNDVYGHVNNVNYYSFFDTAVNRWLIDRGLLDPHQGREIALVVETQCRYARPLSFPDRVDAGLRVAHVGRTSIRYELGLFRDEEDSPAAAGHFIHVYVDRDSRQPIPIPAAVRTALEDLWVPPSGLSA